MKIHPKMTLEELAGYVCQKLTEVGIDAFLSGGGVVSIYVENPYLSLDLDFVTMASAKEIERAMGALGFKRKVSRHYFHPDHPASVEFPGSASTIGEEYIRAFAERETPYGKLKLLTPTDSVKDRLCAFFHWKDRQSFDQAVLIARKYPVKWDELERFARGEGSDAFKKYPEFLEAARRGSGRSDP